MVHEIYLFISHKIVIQLKVKNNLKSIYRGVGRKQYVSLRVDKFEKGIDMKI